MNIADRCVVTIHYKLTNDAGETLDSSEGDEPMVYLHGARNLITGLENELTGKAAGDDVAVTIQPEDAYGDVDEDKIQTVPRSSFDGAGDIEAGMQFEARGADGHTHVVTVTDVGDDEVTVDGNHPLAGQVLHFQVRVKDVRAATAEEIAHGHAHGAGGHHHH